MSQMLCFNNKDALPKFLTTTEQVKKAVIIDVASGGLIVLKAFVHNIPKLEGQC